MSDDRLRILVADDHTLLREALCDVLRHEADFEVVAQAGSGPATIKQAAKHRPDVVLLDAEMPQSHPAVTVRKLLENDPTLHIFMLSMHDNHRLVQELLAIGIKGYLHKSVNRETLISALRGLAVGDHQVVTVSVSRMSLTLAPPVSQPEDQKGLSYREIEILDLVAKALSNRQISSRLGITESTVKRHLRNIFAKLDAVSRIDAANKAIELALIRHPAA